MATEQFTESTRPMKFSSDDLRHTKQPRVLHAAIGVLVLLSLGLLIGLIIVATQDNATSDAATTDPPTTPPPAPRDDVCLTPGCISSAADLLSIINEDVNPCENFYDFACGNWELKNVIPEDAVSYGTFSKVRDSVEIRLKVIMESGNATASQFQFSKTTMWAKQVFDACVDQAAVNQASITPFSVLANSTGGWSLGVTDPIDEPWLDVAAKIRAYDSSYVILMYVSTDRMDVSRRVIYLDQPSLGLSAREDYFPKKQQVLECVNITQSTDVPPTTTASNGDGGQLKPPADENVMTHVPLQTCIMVDDPDDDRPEDEVFWQDARISAYRKYLNDLAMLKVEADGNAGVDQDDLDDQVKSVIRLEQKIANATTPQSERRNATALYNPMTINELVSKYPHIGFKDYIDTVFSQLPENERPTGDTVVIVREKEYFENLNTLLQDATYYRELKNYMLLRLFMRMAPHLDEKVGDARLDFRSVLYGVTATEARWKQCLELVRDELGMAVGKLYVDRFFDETAKQTALDMIHDVLEAFKGRVDTISWMDDETKTKTKKKADAITPSIAYPEVITDPITLDELYKGLNLPAGDSNGDNVKNLWKFSSESALQKLYEPVDKSDWFTTPAVVNAYYSPTQNGITFPAGILNPPFFAADTLKALNYGAIGVVVGHEITHGFDDQGRQTDQDGNLNQWWSEEAIEKFVEKAACIVQQYGNYSEVVMGETLYLNGINTQGENIADNGGVKQSYKAYRTWVSENGSEEKRLPGLESYTNDQLFFINYANVWCGLNREEYLRVRILTGVHSPGKYRIIGPLSNSADFNRVFSCPNDAPMNREDKCDIW